MKTQSTGHGRAMANIEEFSTNHYSTHFIPPSIRIRFHCFILFSANCYFDGNLCRKLLHFQQDFSRQIFPFNEFPPPTATVNKKRIKNPFRGFCSFASSQQSTHKSAHFISDLMCKWNGMSRVERTWMLNNVFHQAN